MSYKFGIRILQAALILGVSALPCFAQTTVDDPLHGYCAGVGQCVDNGTNSPTSANPPSNFGFTVSPGPASGDLLVDVLTQNNEPASSFLFTGTVSGTATLFSSTAWTSGDLDAYLGISASPNNPLDAFLPSTQALDPGATGFFVYQIDLGSLTLQGPSSPNVSPLENITGGVPEASYIVGFLNEGTTSSPNWIATAPSGAIFETGTTTAPEPGSLLLLAAGLVAVLSIGRRKIVTA